MFVFIHLSKAYKSNTQFNHRLNHCVISALHTKTNDGHPATSAEPPTKKSEHNNNYKTAITAVLFHNSINSYLVVPRPIDSAYGNMCRPICRSMRSCNFLAPGSVDAYIISTNAWSFATGSVDATMPKSAITGSV